MKKIELCPFCASDKVNVVTERYVFECYVEDITESDEILSDYSDSIDENAYGSRVQCRNDCGFFGPWGKSEDEAIDRWNRRDGNDKVIVYKGSPKIKDERIEL